METQGLLNPISRFHNKSGTNLWILLSGSISVYFTVVFGLPLLIFPYGHFFKLHLINAILVSWLCVFNLVIIPNLGSKYKDVHKVTGKIALVCGCLSTLFGYITVWHERYQGITPFSIGITIGGTAQVYAQIMAIRYIKRGNRALHIKFNHIAYYAGCLTPAFIRLPILLNMNLTSLWPVLAWIFPIAIGRFAFKATVNNTWI